MANENETGAGSVKLDDTVVVYTLRLRRPGVKRKVASGDVRVRAKAVEDRDAQDPDESAVSVSKTLLESPAYKEIGALDSYARSYVRSQSLPTRLAGGQYLVPLGLVERVDAQVSELAAKRGKLVEAFVAAYPQLVEDARKRLGDLWDAEDYAKPEDVASAFDVRSSIAALEFPGSGLARISSALYARECKKAERARVQLVGEIQDGIRHGFAELVSTLVNKLAPKDGSKPAVLANQVDKLQAFIRDFSSLNVARDGQLEALVTQARDLVKGVDAGKLRSSVKARDAVAKGLTTVRDALDGLISADASTLRSGALELEGTLGEGATPAARPALAAPEASARAARLDLSETVAVPVAASDPTAARPYLDLGDAPTPIPAAETPAAPVAPVPTFEAILATIPQQTPSGRWLDVEARRAIAGRELDRLTTAAAAAAPRPTVARPDGTVARAAALELDAAPVGKGA